MTDVLEERLRSAADEAMAGVELTPPDIDHATAPDRPQRRWLTAVAGIAAAIVIGLVAWAAGLRDPGPTEPVQPAPDAPAQVRARAAVEATLSAPQWRAEIGPGSNAFEMWFREPDRVESAKGVVGDESRAIQIGGDLYYLTDGNWVRTNAPSRGLDESHRSLLEGLLADGPCFADQDGLIVAWQDPETGCGSSTTALPDDLPPGSDIWVLRTDAEGRVAELAVGEIPGAVGSERRELGSGSPTTDRISDPISAAGGRTGSVYRFTYNDIPPITAPDQYTTDPTAPPITSDTGDTICALRVVTTAEATREQWEQLERRHAELTFDQQRPATEVAEQLRTFPFVVSVTAPGEECPAQGGALSISPAE